MTIAEKKSILLSYARLNAQINQKLDDYNRWNDIATNISPTLDSQNSGYNSFNKNHDKVGSSVAKMATISLEIKAILEKLISTKIMIESSINKLTDSSSKCLLLLRYINCKTWEQISDEMSFSIQHLYRIHEKSLKEIRLKKEKSNL